MPNRALIGGDDRQAAVTTECAALRSGVGRERDDVAAVDATDADDDTSSWFIADHREISPEQLRKARVRRAWVGEVGARCAVEQCHEAHRNASATLWPPKPKEFDNATPGVS